MSGPDDFKDLSLAQLFRMEAEGQLAALTAGALALEQGDTSQLEAMMRAAHSLKGAARIVGFEAAVRVAHAMEDCFVAAQRGEVEIGQPQIDRLLVGIDLLKQIAQTTDDQTAAAAPRQAAEADAFVEELEAALKEPPTAVGGGGRGSPDRSEVPAAMPRPTPVGAERERELQAEVPPAPAPGASPTTPPMPAERRADPRVLRVTADHLNRLLGLAGESLLESRRLRPFGEAVGRLKILHHELAGSLDAVRSHANAHAPERLNEALTAAQQQLARCREFLADRMSELETHDRRTSNVAHRLYDEALTLRMRPFSDGLAGFPRLVRDTARELGKEAQLTVTGEDTQVDRDILERLEAPLGHLLRNAVDHGIETPDARRAAGKPAAGRITLEAQHSAGVLLIAVSDDGRGADPEEIRAAVVRKKLVAPETAAKLSEAELLEFLFLPGFTLKDEVTEISGRGVGLDVVQAMVKAVRGHVRVSSQPGRGMRFQLQLPLTLSVVRALLIEIAGEPYAVPLGFIIRTLRLPEGQIASTQGRQHFEFESRRIGLVSAHQVLGRAEAPRGAELAVVVLGTGEERYGVVVDQFLGERELVVQPLDARLGKVKDIAAAALMEDGAPLLIIDVADFVRSVEKIAASGQLSAVHAAAAVAASRARKRVLVVDDSLTVRELERKLLEARGYAVEIAVDGMDGWNAVRTGAFTLVLTDVDMPRLDGIELTRLIKQDAKLRALPVMIVSYKDREDDRRRGLEAGADYYLTKGSFHDETMLNAVEDLIGRADELDAESGEQDPRR